MVQHSALDHSSIAGGVVIIDESTTAGTASTLKFVGSGGTAAVSGGTATITHLGVVVQNAGTAVGTAEILNFTNGTATYASGTATINLSSGGGASVPNHYVGSPQALFSLGSSVTTALAADRVYITKFIPSADITVDTAAWNCATSAGNLDLGIYNEALDTKLGSTGAFASPGTGKRTQALTGSVALTAGTVYYLAFWSNNASLLVTTYVMPGAAGFGAWNLVGIQSSVSTNLPASITPTWDPGAIGVPIFWFLV